MIYELRIYRTLPGRLPNLLARFQNHTLRIWERHGIRQAGFWTTLAGESNYDLTYLPLGNRWRSARSSGRRSPPIRNGSQRAPNRSRTARSSPTSATSS